MDVCHVGTIIDSYSKKSNFIIFIMKYKERKAGKKARKEKDRKMLFYL
jgi:hypothetical protein